MSGDRMVIVGASLAGAKAAETLREEGHDGPIVLVGDDPERPYERPPLSKDYLQGKAEQSSVYVHPETFYADNHIELRTSVRAVALDVAAREVELDDGGRLAFDSLLIATGAEPRRLPVPGAELDNVLYLRTLEDSARLKDAIARSSELVVAGGGWIGSEVAASARQSGANVTIVERDPLPLGRILGKEVATVYRDVHTDHGTRVITDVTVDAFEGEKAVEGVRLGDGRRLPADLVVVGVGVVPRVELAEQAGLTVGNGVVVDEGLRTSSEGIFAAGDVASAWHPRYQDHIRVEHWANALHQGPAAARSMIGQSVSYDRLPYFFSDQYDTGMEYSGYALSWDEVVFRGDPAEREFLAFWLDRDVVLAGMNFNVWDVNDAVQDLIGGGLRVDPARLADPDVPLDKVAAA